MIECGESRSRKGRHNLGLVYLIDLGFGGAPEPTVHNEVDR